MEEIYKDHAIFSGARAVPHTSEWKPIARVYWSEHGEERIKSWDESHFRLTFETHEQAEMEAHLFARKWIDDGKPNLEP